MKAIETRYADCRFRSRLEARWAVFFDAMRIQWAYEPEGIETLAGRYLPDFWLPGLNLWVEVKPEAPTEKEREKAGDLLLQSGNMVFITSGYPDQLGELHWSCTSQGGEWNWVHAPGWVDWNTSRALGWLQVQVLSRHAVDSEWHDHKPARILPGEPSAVDGRTVRLSGPARVALRNAKSARFEFGECGGPSD